MKKNAGKVLVWLLTLSMMITFIPGHALADESPVSGTVVFSGDADHIYFAGDTADITLSINGITSTGAVPVRVSFGLLDESNNYTSTDIFASGKLTDGSSDGTGYYMSTVMTDGSLTLPISGTLAEGLSTGIIAVKLYADMNGAEVPGGWTDLLQMAGSTPSYIPLSESNKPAMVGLDDVLPTGITTVPAWNTITDFYDSSLDIEFVKTLTGTDKGSITFANIDFTDPSAVEQLSALGSGLVINQDTPGAGGPDRQYSFGVDSTALSALAAIGATISVTSDSFDGLTADNFNLGAAEVGGPAYMVRSFDSSTNTISFTVPHFSGYILTMDEDAGGISFTYSQENVTTIGAVDGSITLTASGGGGTYDYTLNNGDDWSSLSTNPCTIAALSAGTYQVMVRDTADTLTPSAMTEITILQPTAPDAPAVTCDDTENTVSGMSAGMEYDLDGAGYVAYDATVFNALNFSGAHTLLVRVAADGYNPAGAVTTLTFTAALPKLTHIYEIGAGSNIDAAADGSGNVYAVYENAGNICFAKNRQNVEIIPGGGSDSIPSIAIGADGTVHVVFIRGTNVTYAKRTVSGIWSTETIAAGSYPDIDVDLSGYAHIVYMNSDQYPDIIYAVNSTGSFVTTTIWDGFWYYDNGSGTGRYFASPSIKVDHNGFYHISAAHHAYDKGMGWSDHNYYIVYATNSGGADISSPSFGNNGSVSDSRRSMTLQENTPAIVYEASGNVYISANTMLIGGGAPAAAASDSMRGIAYNSSGVKYILNTGSGFSGAAAIDDSGANPAVAVDDSNSYVYYEKSGKVYLAADKVIAPPMTVSITDNDNDKVYFEGDTVSFTLSGLAQYNGQTLRVAFGTVDDTGVFSSENVIDGLTADAGSYYKTASVSDGTFSSDLSGTLKSGLSSGIIAIKLFYESAPDSWTDILAASPQPYILLSDGSKYAYKGISLPVGITSSPELGSGAQSSENLYNMDIGFSKTIDADTGITGNISFTGLDLINSGTQLEALNSAIKMIKEVDSGTGFLEKYTLGVDTGTLTLLDGKEATVRVSSPSFDGKTKDDFAAASADVAGGIANGLLFDDSTDTVSFTVNHFSDYTLKLIDPSDANGDGYYDGDVAAMKAFLSQDSAVPGKMNGDILRDSGFLINDPSTYPCVTWSGSPKRVTTIHWDSSNGYHTPDLKGSFDLRALSELTSLILEGTDSNTDDEIAEGVIGIQVSGLDKLQTLHIRMNSLSDLSISGCAALTDLDCQENLITALNLTGATELVKADFGYNKLNNAGITGLSALVKLNILYCYDNLMTSLDLSPFTALSILDCQDNSISALDFSNNAAITEIYCNGNDLSSLDVSGKTMLASLYCNDCMITDIDITGDDNLQSFDCSNNRIKLSQLPVTLPVSGGSYGYAPQSDVPITLTNGNVADLSDEASIDGSDTVFAWYNSGDSLITSGITESPTGVFTFDRTVYGGTNVYATMTNTKFSGLTLITSTVAIQTLPSCGVPSPGVSGTNVSWASVANSVGYKVQIYHNDGVTTAGGIIALSGRTIDLALLPGDTVQTLPGGDYKVKAMTVGDGINYADSAWSAASGTVTLSLSPVEQATAAVITAEGTPTQVNVNAAQTLVTGLPAGSDKTALQSRIDAVQSIVDAAAALAVQNMITALPAPGDLLLSNTSVGTARTAYNALTTAQKALVTNYTVLTTAETKLTDLNTATNAVSTAETTSTQANVNAAQTLVTALPAGAAKTALQGRIDTAQGTVDAATALTVQNMITALPAPGDLLLSNTSVGAARTAYTALTTAQKALVTNYTVLTTAEAQLMALGGATNAVSTAETTPTQANVNSAQTPVTALPTGAAKTALQGRIDAVQNIINATAAVVTAETTPTQANLNTAQTLVNALPSGTAKTGLLSRLDAVQTILENEAVAAINAADTVGMGSVITTYSAILGLNLTDYNSLTSKGAIYTALTGKAFANKGAVKTAFDAAVTAEMAIENPHSGGTHTVPAAPASDTSPKTETSGSQTKVETTLTATISAATGNITAAVSSDTMTSMAKSAAAAESDGKQAVVEIKVDTASGSSGTTVEIPRTSFNEVANNTNADVTIKTGIASVTLDPKTVESISSTVATGDISINIATVDTKTLDSNVQQIVGDKPVFDFSITAGSSKISTFGGGSVTVSIPYTPQGTEDKNAIVVYYINNAGGLETMQGAYNAETGMVEFVTNHFSKYAIGYNKVTFTDVSDSVWYNDAVTFIAARGITTGTGDNHFSPDATITRAEFIVMLMKAYGISPEENAADNFSDAGNTYYTDYLAAAKKLGIAAGSGNGAFLPESRITRQDMFTLLYRALDVIGQMPEAGTDKSLSDFSDSAAISDYAKTAMDYFVGIGVISGSNGKIDNLGISTRAQMAQVLYTLLSK